MKIVYLSISFRLLVLASGMCGTSGSILNAQLDMSILIIMLIIIIMYIYHALINALSAHMIHINLNMIFYTHVKHSPTKTIYIKYYLNLYIYKNKIIIIKTHHKK